MSCVGLNLNFEYRDLKDRIKQYFRTRRDFAQAVGYSESAISAKLACRLFITQADIVEWSKVLHISKSEYGKYFFS